MRDRNVASSFLAKISTERCSSGISDWSLEPGRIAVAATSITSSPLRSGLTSGSPRCTEALASCAMLSGSSLPSPSRGSPWSTE